LTLALLDASHGNYPEGTRKLEAWVESKPSYSRYLYLAYFYQAMEKPKEAAAAMEKATGYPIIDLEDDQSNTECRGYSAAMYAFKNQKYGTVVKLCDVLLPVKENGNYAKSALQSLRDAALAAQSGGATAFVPDPNVLLFNPYDKVPLDLIRTL
jgi:hypothetical protein